ncbi:MAG TPA: PIN domain-containing protein [Candidatus Limnocylindrales bacterium]
MPARVFCDTSVLIRYFAEDDPPRALAAARLFDSDATLVVSTTALLELVHVLRTRYGVMNPRLGEGLISFLTRDSVELVDADQGATVAAIRWSLRVSARRIPDAIIAAAAEHARCDAIATFDERMESPTVPVRLL